MTKNITTPHLSTNQYVNPFVLQIQRVSNEIVNIDTSIPLQLYSSERKGTIDPLFRDIGLHNFFASNVSQNNQFRNLEEYTNLVSQSRHFSVTQPIFQDNFSSEFVASYINSIQNLDALGKDMIQFIDSKVLNNDNLLLSDWTYFDMEQKSDMLLCNEYNLDFSVLTVKLLDVKDLVLKTFDQMILALDLTILVSVMAVGLKELHESAVLEVEVNTGTIETLFQLRKDIYNYKHMVSYKIEGTCQLESIIRLWFQYYIDSNKNNYFSMLTKNSRLRSEESNKISIKLFSYLFPNLQDRIFSFSSRNDLIDLINNTIFYIPFKFNDNRDYLVSVFKHFDHEYRTTDTSALHNIMNVFYQFDNNSVVSMKLDLLDAITFYTVELTMNPHGILEIEFRMFFDHSPHPELPQCQHNKAHFLQRDINILIRLMDTTLLYDVYSSICNYKFESVLKYLLNQDSLYSSHVDKLIVENSKFRVYQDYYRKSFLVLKILTSYMFYCSNSTESLAKIDTFNEVLETLCDVKYKVYLKPEIGIIFQMLCKKFLLNMTKLKLANKFNELSMEFSKALDTIANNEYVYNQFQQIVDFQFENSIKLVNHKGFNIKIFGNFLIKYFFVNGLIQSIRDFSLVSKLKLSEEYLKTYTVLDYVLNNKKQNIVEVAKQFDYEYREDQNIIKSLLQQYEMDVPLCEVIFQLFMNYDHYKTLFELRLECLVNLYLYINESGVDLVSGGLVIVDQSLSQTQGREVDGNLILSTDELEDLIANIQTQWRNTSYEIDIGTGNDMLMGD